MISGAVLKCLNCGADLSFKKGSNNEILVVPCPECARKALQAREAELRRDGAREEAHYGRYEPGY